MALSVRRIAQVTGILEAHKAWDAHGRVKALISDVFRKLIALNIVTNRAIMTWRNDSASKNVRAPAYAASFAR